MATLRVTAPLGLLCLALVLPAEAFWSTVCSGCTCTEGPPFVIDCSDRDFTSAYTSSDSWPENKTDIHLLYDKNSMSEVAEVPAQNITELSYQHNDLTRIVDGAFAALLKLQRLDLSHNKLDRSSLTEKTFQGQFSADDYQPSPIRQLDLSYNNIHSIFEEVMSHFSSLTELSLSYNPISVLDHHTQMAITSLPHLHTLRLAGTGLAVVPHGMLHTLITLRHLDLADNKLEEVPSELHNSHAIQTLTLDKNPIREIDEESFRGMVKLSVLNLSKMPKLEYITEKAFSTLVALRILRCRNNERLWSVSPRIFEGMDTSPGIFPLKELFLSGNNLTTLAAETVPFWDQLEQLQLHGNPWRCDCRLQWMADSMLPQLEDMEPNNAQLITCQLPKKLADVPILEAVKENGGPLPCPPPPRRSLGHSGSSTELAVALTIGGLVICSAAGFVLFVFWRRNKIREMYSNKLYMTTMFGACLILVVCVFFFWLMVAEARSGAPLSDDPVLLQLIGCFVLFLLIASAAALFVIRRQTMTARYRAKQQIRYRRAAMEEEAEIGEGREAEDTTRVVST